MIVNITFRTNWGWRKIYEHNGFNVIFVWYILYQLGKRKKRKNTKKNNFLRLTWDPSATAQSVADRSLATSAWCTRDGSRQSLKGHLGPAHNPSATSDVSGEVISDGATATDSSATGTTHLRPTPYPSATDLAGCRRVVLL